MPGFVTCGPNEVLVISGCCHSKPYLVPGGRVFVWPWFQIIQKMSLNTMTLTIESPDVYTKEGVPVTLTGIAQVRIIANNPEMISLACEHFLCKTEAEIISIVKETLEGKQREIMAAMTVEDIYQDQKNFSKKVFQAASGDLLNLGLAVVSYTVKNIKDNFEYLKSLGEASTANVKKDAKISETEAYKEAKLQQNKADELKQSSCLENKIKTISSEYEFQKNKYEYDKEVYEKQAEAKFAADLQQAETKNKITTAKLDARLEESTMKVDLADLQKQKMKAQLVIDFHKLADAEYQRAKILAKAYIEKGKIEAEAMAEAIKLEGAAKADLIQKTGVAEGEMLAKKASVLKDYNTAARMDMILETLPKVAAEIATPLTKCNKITMVSQGDGEIGANKLTEEILNIMNKVHGAVEKISVPGDDSSLEDKLPKTSPLTSIATPTGSTYGDVRKTYSFLKKS